MGISFKISSEIDDQDFELEIEDSAHPERLMMDDQLINDVIRKILCLRAFH